VINIYPLSIMDEIKVKERSYPMGVELIPLSQQLKIVQGAPPILGRLVENLFNKIVMVQDYKTAMSVAKEHHFTCITLDCEMVHAGAFVTKVGKFQKKGDRISLYNKANELERHIAIKI